MCSTRNTSFLKFKCITKTSFAGWVEIWKWAILEICALEEKSTVIIQLLCLFICEFTAWLDLFVQHSRRRQLPPELFILVVTQASFFLPFNCCYFSVVKLCGPPSLLSVRVRRIIETNTEKGGRVYMQRVKGQRRDLFYLVLVLHWWLAPPVGDLDLELKLPVLTDLIQPAVRPKFICQTLK